MRPDAKVDNSVERHRDRLLERVGRYIAASPETTEDACAFVWLQWARHRPQRRDPFGWLFLVAAREALRLARDEERRQALAFDAVAGVHDPRLDPEPSVTFLDAYGRLRPRQRAVLAMGAEGLSYHAISRLTGDSVRTVDRQLVGGRAALRMPSRSDPVCVRRRAGAGSARTGTTRSSRVPSQMAVKR
jgi:DNA-directed RNA polymerase specialized sigma24 family protein